MLDEYARVWPMLERAVRRYGNLHTKESILQRLLDGRAQLWTDKDAAVVSRIERYDTGFVEIECWLGGGKMAGCLRLEKRIEAWGKSIGANRIGIVGRKGWPRALPGYREIITISVKDI
ncbi:hypothetical protein ACX3P0_02740 [Mesorhizobium sp. A556]